MDENIKEKYKKYEKRITINMNEKEVIFGCLSKLFHFMYENTKFPEFFRIKYTNSEITRNSKDLIIEWCEIDYEKNE